MKKETRNLLMKKLLTICPICGKQIYGRDIDITNIDLSKISKWPFRYTHCHSNRSNPMHAVTLYLDSNFAVRGKEISEFLKIQD
ncbi:MAG: hypothetical protein BAJALOKI2v1_480024 [Promethearchaeota archaeon]|nr:MAG: hypothetical protein BAJALOKI2v1_480024 [Candidatus Lokiarchaeota archaeon]